MTTPPEQAPTREEAARVLARAIDEQRTAKLRLASRTRIVGFHGEDFEKRWPRVEGIVNAYNEKAVRAAWENALRAGWTEAELHGAGLDAETVRGGEK